MVRESTILGTIAFVRFCTILPKTYKTSKTQHFPHTYLPGTIQLGAAVSRHNHLPSGSKQHDHQYYHNRYHHLIIIIIIIILVVVIIIVTIIALIISITVMIIWTTGWCLGAQIVGRRGHGS